MMRSPSASTIATIRLVSINDVYKLDNLPKLQTFLSNLSKETHSTAPSGVLLCGDFISPSALSAIDGGRGMCDTLRAAGITHCSFGNHEADFGLSTLRDRVKELTKSIIVLNTNIQRPSSSSCAGWLTELTKPYSIISSQCGLVRVALLGLLSDGDNMFRDGTFKGLTINNVPAAYNEYYNNLVPNKADFVLPMTHQSLEKDRILAKAMSCKEDSLGVIFGGHEHELIDETTQDGIRIFKTGCDANHALLIDFKFDIPSSTAQPQKPRLLDLSSEFVDLTAMKDSFVVKKIVDKHMSGIRKMDEEIIVDESVYDTRSNNALGPLSSEGARYKQTTVGGFFCQAMKEELEVDVAIINGASIKGGMTYHKTNNRMSYSQLKNELPFPTKIVIVPMTKGELLEAIQYSRTNLNENDDDNVSSSIVHNAQMNNKPRKGYLQVDFDFHNNTGSDDTILQVALPRNLMSGFCNIKPLIQIGTNIQKSQTFPSPDNFVPALDLVTRHCCKAKWMNIIKNHFSFFDLADLNHDGVLDRKEVECMLEKFLGYVPSDFVVDDMIKSIDIDENGVIDSEEFSYILAKMERNIWNK